MAKPKIPNQRNRYAKLRGRLNKYALAVQDIYDTLNKEAARIAASTDFAGNGVFRFSDYPMTADAVNRLQGRFVHEMQGLIYAGTAAEWKESNLVQDLLASKVLKTYGAQVGGKKTKVYYQSNSDALKAFQQRTEKGMNLSEKLWNQSGNYKQELEYAISSAVEKGTSAVTLSKHLSKYLNDFPSLKADYKEKFGQAVTCHDCEYRSIRLARTEINMAYRTAEQTRWKQMDFVVGYEVKISYSHEEKDICDSAQGKYPKDFVFVGWHPNCMCYVIPILKTEDEFWADDQTAPSVNEVTDVPDGMKTWVAENQGRIAQAEVNGTLPYWYADNTKYVGTAQIAAEESIIEEPFVMTDDDLDLLISRGFRRRGIIDAETFNNSAMAGFNVIEFDKMFEGIMDEYHVTLKTKELSGYGERATLRYVGKTVSGEEVELNRYFRYEEIDGKRVPVVDHKLFVLPDEMQGKGISKMVFRNMVPQYERMGIERAYIHANITKGAFAWSKYGALAEKKGIEDIAHFALREGRITAEEHSILKSYLSKFGEMVPMQEIAYSPFGERLLDGQSWFGYIDFSNKVQKEYLHSYLGIP